ncbi:hypothetical protein BN1058_00865 [Paraliobacillus sp. PM-2]|nr:hypothetical protein BN1058_00865 [Paraliobacillus sp. PM-2]
MHFFENIATAEGLNGWKTTSGGSGDTRVWVAHGIESVNLLAGYRNEYRDEEVLDVTASYQTARLVKVVCNNGKELRSVLRKISRKGNERKYNETSLIKQVNRNGGKIVC